MAPQKSICGVTLAIPHCDLASGYVAFLTTRKPCIWNFCESINS